MKPIKYLLEKLSKLDRFHKKILSILLDSFGSIIAFSLSIAIVNVSNISYPPLVLVFIIHTTLLVGLFSSLDVYNTVLRYIGNRGIIKVVALLVPLSIALWLMLAFNKIEHAIGLAICYFFIVSFILVTTRLSTRLLFPDSIDSRRTNVLIYGAGSAGRQLAIALSHGREYSPCGFIDDDDDKQGKDIKGLQVYSPLEIQYAIDNRCAEVVLLALPSTLNSRKKEILDQLQSYDVKVMTTPGMADIVKGNFSTEYVKEVDISDLLGRDPIPPISSLMTKNIMNKSVMITGAGGSIGSELCRQVLAQHPKTIVLFELSEFALYTIEKELSDFVNDNELSIQIIPIIGSVQCVHRIEAVMKTFQVNTVYHAAAYKHVPLVEHNVAEGVRNNIFGTLHTAKAAINAKVESFVLISTDKAVRPTNIMGATKRMAELVLQALADEQTITRFCMVRFGNVLGSSGSVIPLFRKQIQQGGPITLTHPDITRFFMTIPEAAELVIQAGSMGIGGDVFVLDMGESVKIRNLAEKLVLLSGLSIKSSKNPDGDIAIKCTGLRPGEKLFEELLIGDSVAASSHNRILTANETKLGWEELELLLRQLDEACDNFEQETIRQILLKAPTSFQPNDGICDLVWNRINDGETS